MIKRANEQMNGQTNGKAPHSTGLRPLSGPLPKKATDLGTMPQRQGWQKNRKFEKARKSPGFFKKPGLFPGLFQIPGFFKIDFIIKYTVMQKTIYEQCVKY